MTGWTSQAVRAALPCLCPAGFRHDGAVEIGFSGVQAQQVLRRHSCDFVQCLAGQERLVGGYEHVGKREQEVQFVVLEQAFGVVLENPPSSSS